MLSIKNHQLIGPNVTHIDTKKKSGKIKEVLFGVIHYTASDNYESDVATLSTGPRPASCHLVVAPDGRITQIGALNDRLWHAGESSWKGYNGMNSYAIGIEVTCPGPVDGDQSRYGAKYKAHPDQNPYELIRATHHHGGGERTWALYTDAQIAVLQELCPILSEYYKLREWVGHDDIAPTRKIDPGPSCPRSVFQYINGNKEDATPVERPDLGLGENLTKMTVTGVAPETLTFRTAPNGDKRGELHEGQIVEKLSVQGNWTQVRTPAGYVGWVYSSFVKEN